MNNHDDYAEPWLQKAELAADPVSQFRLWYAAAEAAGLAEPGAMALATATADGRPSVRLVLLRGFDARGFVFYTNYDSDKARDLAANPRAAAVFWWEPLARQVRLEGPVAPIAAAESDAYFAGRPRGSQVGAWASPQSQVIESRADLVDRVQAAGSRFAGAAPVPRPPNWGGYRLTPVVVEFWQGRVNRLHDRLRYRQSAAGDWVIERLAP